MTIQAKKNFFSMKTIFNLLILLVLPFFLIPFIALILKTSLLIGSILPSWMIIMKINTNEIVSISTFIYYYTCFLAIEVTGILSYAIYQFSVTKGNEEISEKERELKAKNVNKLLTFKYELQRNHDIYLMKRTQSMINWSFFDLVEDVFFKSFDYKDAGKEFRFEKWEEIAGDLRIFCKQNGTLYLFEKIEYIYKGLYELRNNSEREKLNNLLFEDFSKIFKEAKEDCEKVIEDLSS